MDKEDYTKYYIKGSDHYLIPKDEFIGLFSEMENWREEVKELKKKYLNAVADYETTMFEKEQSNSLVNSCQEENQELKKQLEVGEQQYNDLVEEKEELQEQLSIRTLQLEEIKLSKRDYTQENILEMKLTLKENQQKKFIEYLEDLIKQNETVVEVSKYGLPKNCSKLLIDFYKEILQKYKSIIGGKE